MGRNKTLPCKIFISDKWEARHDSKKGVHYQLSYIVQVVFVLEKKD